MTDAEVIQILREYFASLFPKVCPNCGRRFVTLAEYIQITKRVGLPMSYDADLRDWETPRPIGSLALANCPCGSTLSLSTEGMPMNRRLELLNWVKVETQRRGLTPSQLLDYLRDEVRKQTLAKSTPVVE
ncbi:MAG TPA: hypothetical protein VL970_03145 [Candidatus Acidoferrales bacterium]|nr:hypothetical protein [Candidatus Acidoferrales bacterium]